MYTFYQHCSRMYSISFLNISIFSASREKKTNMNSKNKSNCCLNDLSGLSANLDMVTKKGTPMTNQNSGSKEKSYPQNSQKKIIYSTVQSNVRLFRLCTWSHMRKYAYNEYLKTKNSNHLTGTHQRNQMNNLKNERDGENEISRTEIKVCNKTESVEKQ